MNKSELVSQISKSSSLTKTDAARAIEAIIETITKSLKKGEDVQIIGFGSFKTTSRSASEGRNPRTGQTIKIPARKLARFSAGKHLKDAVAKRV